MACAICHLDEPMHSGVLHQVADEDDGSPRCGCDPRQHDTTGPCIRAAGHVGVCVGLALDDAGKPTLAVVQFSCRDDDGGPHQTTVEAILGGI